MKGNLTITVRVQAHDITYADEMVRGSFKKDVPFGTDPYFVFLNPEEDNIATLRFVLHRRGVIFFFCLAFIELIGVLILFWYNTSPQTSFTRSAGRSLPGLGSEFTR